MRGACPGSQRDAGVLCGSLTRRDGAFDPPRPPGEGVSGQENSTGADAVSVERVRRGPPLPVERPVNEGDLAPVRYRVSEDHAGLTGSGMQAS